MNTARTAHWLKITSLILCIFGGLLLATGAHPAIAWGANLFVDLCFWPLDGAQQVASPEGRLFAAIGGGAFVGLGVMIWLTAQQSVAGNTSAVRTIYVGLLGWCVVDSTFSIIAGAPMNAVFNLVLLAIFAVPLLRSRAATQA